MSELLTEDEVTKAWGNSNFGPKGDTHEGRLELLCGAMENVRRGYDPGGSFMTAIVTELGLIRKRTSKKWKLSQKGQSLLLEAKTAEVERLTQELESTNDTTHEPFDKRTAPAEDIVAWFLCQVIDDDAPLRWTKYRFVANCIAGNSNILGLLAEINLGTKSVSKSWPNDVPTNFPCLVQLDNDYEFRIAEDFDSTSFTWELRGDACPEEALIDQYPKFIDLQLAYLLSGKHSAERNAIDHRSET
jgi:hypothetical protein